uniref:Uncharacterized protein n=1 Tax=Octopus bimaculoides TaxID=37653 RepID=A0A0L8GR00_OCTBM
MKEAAVDNIPVFWFFMLKDGQFLFLYDSICLLKKSLKVYERPLNLDGRI